MSRAASGGRGREAGAKRQFGLFDALVATSAALWSPVFKSDPQRGPGPRESAPSCRAMQLAPMIVAIRARNGLFVEKTPFLAPILPRIGAICIRIATRRS